MSVHISLLPWFSCCCSRFVWKHVYATTFWVILVQFLVSPLCVNIALMNHRAHRHIREQRTLLFVHMWGHCCACVLKIYHFCGRLSLFVPMVQFKGRPTFSWPNWSKSSYWILEFWALPCLHQVPYGSIRCAWGVYTCQSFWCAKGLYTSQCFWSRVWRMYTFESLSPPNLSKASLFFFQAFARHELSTWHWVLTHFIVI